MCLAPRFMSGMTAGPSIDCRNRPSSDEPPCASSPAANVRTITAISVARVTGLVIIEHALPRYCKGMANQRTTALALAFTAAIALVPSRARAQDIPAEYQGVLATLGKKGDFKDGVLKVNIPRSDLTVKIGQRSAPTPFG